LVTSCVGGVFIKSLLKETEGTKDEEEDVSSYWITLRKVEHNGILNKKHYKALSTEPIWEVAVDLSQDKLQNGDVYYTSSPPHSVFLKRPNRISFVAFYSCSSEMSRLVE